MHDEAPIRAVFKRQAGWCWNLGSPLTALVCDLAAGRLDRSTALGRRILDWPAQPGPAADVLALRLAGGLLAGGLHALARGDVIPDSRPAVPRRQPGTASPRTWPLRAARPQPAPGWPGCVEPPPGHAEAPTLRLQTWPGGYGRVLATGSPHGTGKR